MSALTALKAAVKETQLGDKGALAALDSVVAARFPSALTEEERARFLVGVYRGKAEWTSNFEGIQFTLGRAWYTHLEQDFTDAYFANAAKSDEVVERHCPGLQQKMLSLAALALDAKVIHRKGYCGAGVHIFPAGGYCADHGGDLHFDTEGLTKSQLRSRVRAVTFVLMLQPARVGGGLSVWDQKWEGSDDVTDAMIARPHASIDYKTAELVMIDSYSLHQIQPFKGEVDRVSATCHAVQIGDAWEAWF
jgi:hypothetical protein